MRLYDKKIIFILPMVAAMAAVSGCQPKSAAKDEQPASSASVKEQKQAEVPVIQAKVIPVKLPKSKVCLEDGCTEYDFQTVQTNQKWINDYFTNRIKKQTRMLLQTWLINLSRYQKGSRAQVKVQFMSVIWDKIIILQPLPYRHTHTLRVQHMACLIKNL